MTALSYDELSQELVRTLRGARSQPALSRSLGFESNVVYTWESGRRFPEVTSFFGIAETAGVPVTRRLLAFLPGLSNRGRIVSPRGVQRVVRELVGTHNRSELAERIEVDRTTLARWLSGKTEPRLPEFLRLVDTVTQRLLSFVQLFVDPRELDATRAAYEDLIAQRKLAYDQPWSHAVLRALELEAYTKAKQHDLSLLADELGLPPRQVERYLEELQHAGQIEWKQRHYHVVRVLTVDTREQPRKNRALKAHWASVAQRRLEADTVPSSALFSFNLFAISEQAFQRIRELHLDYYDRVRSIIDQSPTADRVVLLNLQLVPLRRAEPDSEADRTTFTRAPYRGYFHGSKP